MTLEDLEESGILLPREQWGKRDLRTGVAKVPLLIVAAAAVCGGVLTYAGNGQTLTWIGLGLFLAGLAGFTWISLRGIR